MSDHISGPRALADPIGDITDVYAFPSPERPGHVVLVANTLPFAQPSDGFSDALVYRFRLRPLRSGAAGDAIPFGAGANELVVDCVFDARARRRAAAGDVHAAVGRCRRLCGRGRAGRRSGRNARLRGLRWDPFILDAPAALKTVATGQLAFTDTGSIYLDGKNVLGLVVELDCERFLGGAELVAVVAETRRAEPPVRIERVGRPEIKNLMLGPKQFDQVNRDLEIRDLYNMEDAFELGESYQGAYRARLNANLAFWDSLDGTVDWPARRTTARTR